jgi:sugar-specific transcriptional regulator TrmB
MKLTKIPEDVEILNNLGLSLNGARVFLALSQLGTSKVKTISKFSGVAREVVYQIMPRLLKKGLVEELITAPKKFKAIPMKEAYAILLQRKEEENRELCARAREALQKHLTKTAFNKENSQTIQICTVKAPDFRICHEYQNVQKSVDLTFPAEKFLQWSQHYAEWGIKEVMKRNVKIQIITETQLLKKLATQPKVFFPSLSSKLGYVNFKYVQNPPSVELMIFDKKTLFISTKKESNINKMHWLRSNNPFIVEMANSYFETIWKKAKETDKIYPTTPQKQYGTRRTKPTPS